MRAASFGWLFALAFSVAGCASPQGPETAQPKPREYKQATPLPGAVRVAFSLPRDKPVPFFGLPWPSELRRTKTGRPDFSDYPGHDATFASEYVATAAEDVEGASLAPVVYFHFDGPFDTAKLPKTAAASRAADASVFLVDVDPESPERGTAVPILFRTYTQELRYVPRNTLALTPHPGFILRPGTLYAAVVRRDLGDGQGGKLGTSLDLELVKWTSPRPEAVEEAARKLHAPVFDALGSRVEREAIAAIAVFRTHTPHLGTEALLRAVDRLANDEAPRILEASWFDESVAPKPVVSSSYLTLQGTYCTPNYQTEIQRAPWLNAPGGRIAFASGEPRLAPIPPSSRYHAPECGKLMRARFVLTIPKTAMPAAGFPLLLSAHGTGGDAHTFRGEHNFAGWAARQGIAVVSTDQPLHGADDERGARPGSREPVVLRIGLFPIPLGSGKSTAPLAFYNPIRPGAARDNLRQAAVDAYVLAHLVAKTDFGNAVRARTATPVLAPAAGLVAPRFDASRLLYAGHSQGSQSVAVLGALDASARAVVLSGCGGGVRQGILRRKDLPIVPILSSLIGFEPGELDEFHPIMALTQTLGDAIDPASYARFYWEPLAGRRPQNVLHYEGVSDTFTPPETGDALAVALRAAHLAPVVRSVDGLGLVDVPRGLTSIQGNVGRGAATSGFVQFRSTRGENGHFVLYYEPEASALLMRFLKSALAGTPVVGGR